MDPFEATKKLNFDATFRFTQSDRTRGVGGPPSINSIFEKNKHLNKPAHAEVGWGCSGHANPRNMFQNGL